jgi:hypothetical protein
MAGEGSSMKADLSEVRRRAWETRRLAYGSSGHRGAYKSLSNCPGCRRIYTALIRLQDKGILSEAQVVQVVGSAKVPPEQHHSHVRFPYEEQSDSGRQKVNARAYANTHQKLGMLAPQPCEDCGAANVEKHHEDYSKPLAVTWLCRRCHNKRHGIGAEGST